VREPAPNLVPRLCLVASAAALGRALQIANGFYDDRALAWLTGAFALAIGAIAARRRPPSNGPLERFAVVRNALTRRIRGENVLGVVTVLAIGWQLSSLFTASPGMYLQERANLGLFRTGVIAEGIVIVLGAAGVRLAARAWFPALLAVHFALGVWMLQSSPNPHIDVVSVHREAFDALWNGQSPYAITFRNIYGVNSGFYNPDLITSDRVMFGYPYPPLSLLLAAPGHLVAGDYRYAHLVAWIGAAAFVGYLGASTFIKLAAALLLTQPRGFFVLEQGWTEPIALLLVAATLFAMTRRPDLAAWPSGLLAVTKQYLLLAAPLIVRFAWPLRRRWRFLLAAAGIAALVTVPLAIVQPRAFVESVVLLQLREPFRIDSLSYLSWGARHDWGAGSFAWSLGAAALALAFSVVSTPNTPAGFALGLALSTFATFAFGSKAFCNYYFFVAGILCCGAAALAAEPVDSGEGYLERVAELGRAALSGPPTRG
jgi:hypothetical protein